MKISLRCVSGLLVAALVAGCSTVDSRISQHRAAFESWPPPVQEMVSHGQVAPGFTVDQVRVALGDPDRVFSRVAATGSFEVWCYADHGPRFSFGVGMGSFHGGSGYSGGVGVSTGAAYPEEKLRVIFDQTGRVSSIEQIRRGR
jgi:outer membrane protein assembly factor BamE (lipoprotein component of BamABCDE complex)